MSPHQTIAVVVRLFAVWLAVYVARTAPFYFREAARSDDPYAGAVIVAIALVITLFLLFLWFFPRTVARGLLESESAVPAEPAAVDTWFAVGCALIGLWLIVPAVTSLLYNFFVVYMAQRSNEYDTGMLQFGWVYYAIQLALGLWLLLGAKGARTLFWWARSRGT